ncbi:MerR family transcriptional regulator [Croceicoccus ponticola]|uniref:MerR family transcriptional regulator n=1 Tax=Croceicoccus ponticola TaxID=2217664 RepID=A0A437GV13_9SPHN|nr:MerR family transcriptional regulator [Croceicoccus ponticola]RVQ65505.1 MerR family transcriptional regulator [Croceicoccus ponticola]
MQDSLFEDGKDPQAFRTIGEVSAALDIKPHVLRYWEEQFPMLRPVKRSGGRRYYRPGDVELLQNIDRLLNHDGYTIRGAVKAIEDGAKKPASVEPEARTVGPAPEMVARLRGAVRVLEESTSEGASINASPPATSSPPVVGPAPADRTADILLKARLRSIREKLAGAILE